MPRATSTSALATLLALVVLTLAAVSAFGDGKRFSEIAEIKLTGQNLPAGWALVEEVIADEAALAKFKTIYGVKAESIVNQIFNAAGQRVQLNYCLFSDAPLAELAAAKISVFTRSQNPIVQSGNSVVEIITGDPWKKQSVLTALGLPGLEGVLLTEQSTPKDWALSAVVLVDRAQLPIFRTKLDAPVEILFNQVFKVNGTIVKINYIGMPDEAAAERLRSVMAGTATEGRVVLRRGQVVIEILSTDPDLVSRAAAALG
ncbi:hypothetical protein [Candidatus Thiodictyon syntrophicum]|jgi:hypothetical protein|uniref:Uncharacterized protein n=1 Tax=Candidatus Thiodictyon syntrophicum TaxID=1166950 RepID=A0A2K8UAF3_9GAMM|nr:hypothetical protein [Candidatus Thiodictyon syntrophicum]AUB82041.1 hypothetical protein THSYN_14540 [Candidatus Thiodictyon syntrophicum]